jgi:hypothetical protein
MLRVLLGLVVVLSFAAGRNPAVSSAADQPARDVHRVGAPNVDLYGNPVERAVGGYHVAPGGDLYEEHNPDTAVLKLGPPSS